jgi:allantoicase
MAVNGSLSLLRALALAVSAEHSLQWRQIYKGGRAIQMQKGWEIAEGTCERRGVAVVTRIYCHRSTQHKSEL